MAAGGVRGGGPGRPIAPADPGSAELARARTTFLADGTVVTDVVREPILASWTRSRHRAIPVDHLEVPFDADVDDDSVLLRAARADAATGRP